MDALQIAVLKLVESHRSVFPLVNDSHSDVTVDFKSNE